jgi:hypothetical protein
VENHPSNKQSVAKENPKPPKKKIPGNTNWHWLIKHPVEFSKNNHTPKTSRLARRPALGALVQLYPRNSAASNPGFPGVARRFREGPPRCGPRQMSRPFREGLAGRPLRISPLARPFPCRLVEPYRLVSRAPNRPPATPLTTLRAALRCGYPQPGGLVRCPHSQPTRPAVSYSESLPGRSWIPAQAARNGRAQAGRKGPAQAGIRPGAGR